jgi:hypothetical protein
MADNPEHRPPEKYPPVADTPHAPIIFFDGAPIFGHANGVFSLTLAVGRTWTNPDGAIVSDHVVAAYLRGSAQALASLRDAIEKVALLAARTGQGAAN